MSRYYTSTRFRPSCPTCGNNLGQLEESFKRLQEQGKTPHEALEALGIERPCCRVRALWPVVLPLGGFYLPHHEAGMLNYLGFKEQTPQPNLAVISLRRAVTGEHFLVSHVDEKGFIGQVATPNSHQPTEVVIHGTGERKHIVLRDEEDLTQEATIRVQTEPGEITRGFPFETRAFRRDIEVDRVRSYFDLAPQEASMPDDVVQGKEVDLDDLIAAQQEDDEELIAV
jgi:DNA-directed RNA polymerase subunit N (RpoN/RPB10)